MRTLRVLIIKECRNQRLVDSQCPEEKEKTIKDALEHFGMM